MTVAVLTDSSSCITSAVAEKYHVRVVPLHLLWGDKEYADWVDITPEQFHAWLKTAKTLPTSSGSAQAEFYDAFEELKGKVDGAVAVTLSSRTSTVYQTALIARDMVPDFPVEVIDSGHLMAAAGLVATGAAQAASTGASLEEVARVARSIIPRVNTFFNVGSIEYFMKGGRLGGMKSDTGDSHVLTSIDGKLAPMEKYASRAEARRRLRGLLKEKAGKDTPLHVAVFHSSAAGEAEQLKDEIASQYSCSELWIGEASPVLTIHLSPDSLGIAFYND